MPGEIVRVKDNSGAEYDVPARLFGDPSEVVVGMLGMISEVPVEVVRVGVTTDLSKGVGPVGGLYHPLDTSLKPSVDDGRVMLNHGEEWLAPREQV